MPNSLGTPSPTALRPARLQLHWAAQVLSATADRWLPAQPDDSHTNLEWRAETSALVGNPTASGLRLALAPIGFALHALRGERTIATLALPGRTLAAAMRWADAQVAAAEGEPPRGVAARDYDMPDHPVRTGAAFTDDTAGMAGLAAWLTSSDRALRELCAREPTATPLRIWPHHFDAGTIIFLDEPAASARQIGVGLSPGDSYYQQPYYYITAYPMPPAPRFSPLAGGGFWRAQPPFVGAVLLGETVAAAPDADAAVRAFLGSAVGVARMMLAPPAA